MAAAKRTNLPMGIIILGDVIVCEEMLEKDVAKSFDKKISLSQARLNIYTNHYVYNIEGMDFRAKLLFFNDDLKTIKFDPAEDIYYNDLIDMNKYYNYTERLKKWAIEVLGNNYIITPNRIFWKYSWGNISIPNPGLPFSGETLQIEYGGGIVA